MQLFLDDDRFPPEGPGWLIARQLADFQLQIMSNGNGIDLISFDHDLGTTSRGEMPTGYACAKWLGNWILDGNSLPKLKEIRVHSMNVSGAIDIEKYFLSLQRSGYLPEQVQIRRV